MWTLYRNWKWTAFICTCPLYNEERNNMYRNVNIPSFNGLTATDKFISLMESEQNKVGKFIWNCYQTRRSKDQSYYHKHATDSFLIIILLRKLT